MAEQRAALGIKEHEQPALKDPSYAPKLKHQL
jgi:hypothetical protein